MNGGLNINLWRIPHLSFRKMPRNGSTVGNRHLQSFRFSLQRLFCKGRPNLLNVALGGSDHISLRFTQGKTRFLMWPRMPYSLACPSLIPLSLPHWLSPPGQASLPVGPETHHTLLLAGTSARLFPEPGAPSPVPAQLTATLQGSAFETLSKQGPPVRNVTPSISSSSFIFMFPQSIYHLVIYCVICLFCLWFQPPEMNT